MRQMSDKFKEILKNTRGQQLVTAVKVYWNNGPIVYSEQEFLWNSLSGLFTFPALLTVGQFDVSNRIDSEGTSLSFNITLDDSDGHINSRLNVQPLSGLKCELYIQWVGLDEPDAFLVGSGLVNSDSTSWEESDRTIHFNIEHILDSRPLSYLGYDGMDDLLANPKHSFSHDYMPFVFGSPVNTKTLNYVKAMSATCTASRDFFAGRVYLLTDVVGFPINEDLDIFFVDPLTLTELGPHLSYRIQPYSEDGWALIPNSLDADVAVPMQIVDRDPTDSLRYLDFTWWWVDWDPATDFLEGYWVDFEDQDGYPSMIACKIIEHLDLGGGKFVIRLSHQPRWFTKREERKLENGFDYQTWQSNFTLDINGKVQENVQIRAIGVVNRLEWVVKTIKYTRIDNSGKLEMEDIDNPSASLHEQKHYYPASSAHASLVVNNIGQDPTNPLLTRYETTFLPEGSDGFIEGDSSFTWTFTDETGFDAEIKPPNVPEDTELTTLYIKNASTPTIKCVLNIFPTVAHEDDQPRAEIRAVSNFKNGRSVFLPNNSNIISYENLIPYETLPQTVVERNMLPNDPVTGFTGELLATCETAFQVFDGKGGIMQCDTSNAVDVLSWIAKVFCGLNVDSSTPSYLALRKRVSKTKMAFVLNRDIPALDVMRTIAWEARIGLGYFGNTVTFTDLTIEPEIKMTFNKSNIILQSFSKSYTKASELITEFKMNYQRDKSQDAHVITFKNNTQIYGLKTQEYNILTLDNEKDVIELLKFWGNRLSRSWRTVKFNSSIEALKLMPNDAIDFDLPILSKNKITGFITSVQLVPSSIDVVIEATLASDAFGAREDGEPYTDESYWLGIPELNVKTDKRLGAVTEGITVVKNYIPLNRTAGLIAVASSG